MMTKAKCLRCGQCCKDYNPFSEDKLTQCPHLEFKGKIAVCKIHAQRPKICRKFFCGTAKAWRNKHKSH